MLCQYLRKENLVGTDVPISEPARETVNKHNDLAEVVLASIRAAIGQFIHYQTTRLPPGFHLLLPMLQYSSDQLH